MIIRKAFWLFGIAFLLLIMFLPGYTKLQELRDRYRDSEVKIRELSIENKILIFAAHRYAVLYVGTEFHGIANVSR